jgi:capsular exopolysaccharide synthesis family protein
LKSKNKIIPKQQSIFQLLMFRYFPYWPLFFGLSILTMTAAWVYLKITNPVYEATATILINDAKKGVEDPRAVESFDIYTSKKIVENEIEVIKSKTLVRETAEILHLFSPVFEEGFFSSVPAYTSCPIMVEVKDVSKIEEAELLKFQYDEPKEIISFNGKAYNLNEWISYSHGEIRFVKNPHLINKGSGPFYFSLFDPREITNGLIKNLDVQPSSKLSTVVNLSIKDVVPQRAENILNALIKSYNNAALNDKNTLAVSTLKFLEDRISLMERDLDSLELSIQQYKSTRGIVDLSEQGKLFLKNVGDNDQRLSDINMQLAVLRKIEDYVLSKKNSTRIVPSTVGLNDSRLSALIQKLYESEIQYERLKKTTAENNPLLLSLQNEIENMRPGIIENIRNQRSSLIAGRANLTSTNEKYASVLETIPRQERELLEASRQQAIKNSVYTFLLQKSEETALSYASSEGDSRLVDMAESSIFPIAPKKGIIYGGAFVFAFFLGIAWVTKKELLNSKVLFRSEIESSTKIPIAAEISHTGLKEYLVMDNPKRPHLTEQFRQLRAAIGLFGETPKKVIMVTSAIAGEGKSFVSLNFSTSLTRSNKKILLVDIDLRNPRLSHFYNASNLPGVAEFLTGNVAFDDIVRRTPTANLYFIAAGKNRANPTEILMNGDLAQLFDRFREAFDYIIVDTAPVDPVIDAFIISPFCDSTLFVVRHGKTPKTILQLLDENIKVKALKSALIVFNGVRSRGLVKSVFGYGYGYGYEYVYSDNTLRKK